MRPCSWRCTPWISERQSASFTSRTAAGRWESGWPVFSARSRCVSKPWEVPPADPTPSGESRREVRCDHQVSRGRLEELVESRAVNVEALVAWRAHRTGDQRSNPDLHLDPAARIEAGPQR